MRPLAFLRRITIDQWRAIDDETARGPTPGRFDARVLAILLVATGAMIVQDYAGTGDLYARVFPDDGGQYWELWGFAWWAGWRVIGYLVIPLVALACMPGIRIVDFHLSLRGLTRHLWIYVVLYLAILPIVVLASRTDGFRATYPFYANANRSGLDLWAWEGCYALQFVALEFFFRGFLLHGLRRAFGANAIFVMMLPYCMIHFTKPLPETIGAIIAGVVLGTLALRTRSIWGGVLIHIAVATTMDLLALAACPGSLPCHQ